MWVGKPACLSIHKLLVWKPSYNIGQLWNRGSNPVGQLVYVCVAVTIQENGESIGAQFSSYSKAYSHCMYSDATCLQKPHRGKMMNILSQLLYMAMSPSEFCRS